MSLFPIVGIALSTLSTFWMAGGKQSPPKPEAAQAAPSQPGADVPYVLEEKAVRIVIQDDGRSVRRVTMRARVKDDLGVRHWGQIPLHYASESERVEIVRSEVLKGDGSIISIGPEAVQDFAVQQPSVAPTFLDLRQKHITVPALRPGDAVLLVAEWIVDRPLVKGHSWFEYSFTRDAVVQEERLEIDVPSSLKVMVKVLSSAPAAGHPEGGEISGERRLYRWRSSNERLPESSESEDEPEEAPEPDVRLTTFTEWTSLGQWIGPLLQPRGDASVTTKARELTGGLAGRQAKIEALYAYVATQIRYVSLSFGLGRYAPRPPAEVLRSQYGDCKDKRALLAAMLEAIGERALPVLVNTTRSATADLPSPAEFDHVVT